MPIFMMLPSWLQILQQFTRFICRLKRQSAANVENKRWTPFFPDPVTPEETNATATSSLK